VDSQRVKSALLSCESQKKAGAVFAATFVKTEATSGLALLAQLVTAPSRNRKGNLNSSTTFL
jgi:hypothetical protein